MPSYAVAVGCDLRGDAINVASALSDLRNFMTPAPIRAIEAWLAELSVIVARKHGDAVSDELRVTAYATRLARYPADVARRVTIGTPYTFWPTWAEMEKLADTLTSPRRSMIAALERGPVPPEPERREATEEERARVQALVDELFPKQSPQDRQDAVNIALRGHCMMDNPTKEADQ